MNNSKLLHSDQGHQDACTFCAPLKGSWSWKSGGWNGVFPLCTKPPTPTQSCTYPIIPEERAPSLQGQLPCPGQYALRLLLPVVAPFNNPQNHCIGQNQCWWKPYEVNSKYLWFFFLKEVKTTCPSLISSQIKWNTVAFSLRSHQEFVLIYSLAQKPNTLNPVQFFSLLQSFPGSEVGHLEWLARLSGPRGPLSTVEKQDTKYASGIF